MGAIALHAVVLVSHARLLPPIVFHAPQIWSCLYHNVFQAAQMAPTTLQAFAVAVVPFAELAPQARFARLVQSLTFLLVIAAHSHAPPIAMPIAVLAVATAVQEVAWVVVLRH